MRTAFMDKRHSMFFQNKGSSVLLFERLFGIVRRPLFLLLYSLICELLLQQRLIIISDVSCFLSPVIVKDYFHLRPIPDKVVTRGFTGS